MGRKNISCDDLKQLYIHEKMSAPKIALRLGCSARTIYQRLKECDISIRTMSEAALLDRGVGISIEELKALYLDQHLSIYEIGERYGCSPVTIHRWLNHYGIEVRPAGGSTFEYPKKDFDGSLSDKAYLIGFRLGDLHVEEGSWAIRIRCTSTHQEQIDLVRRLFEEYGGVWISEPREKRGVGITAHLNLSFDFLVRKADEIEDWILDDDELFLAFLAGYVDAEGSFIVSVGRAIFKLDTCDKGILQQACEKLNDMGIVLPSPRIVRQAGTWIPQFRLASRRDLWRLTTENKSTLLRICDLLEPYLKHEKRQQDMARVKAILE